MLWCDTLSVGRSSISCLKLCVNSLPSKEGKTEPSRQAKEQPQRRSSKYARPHPDHNHHLILIFDFDQLTCNPLNLMTTQCGKENRTTINNGRFSSHEATPMFSHQICQSASWTQPSSCSCWLGPNLSNTASYEKDSLCLKNPCKRKIQQWRMTMCAPLQYFLCLISIVVGERGSQECNAKMETVHTYFVCICILYISNYL